MSRDYAREKLHLATIALVSGERDLKDRLEAAALTIHSIRPKDDLPEDLSSEFESLWNDLTFHPAEIEGEGTIQATIRTMTLLEARETAERIFGLYLNVLGVQRSL